MANRSGNATWVAYPSTSTLVTDTALNNIESTLNASVNTISGASSKVSIGGTAVNPTIDVNVANLGTGTPSASKYLDGSGAWSTPAGGGVPNWTAGGWSIPGMTVMSTANNAWPSANNVFAVPFTIFASGTCTGISLNVTTAAAAGNSVRLGLYNVASNNPYGSQTLIIDAGTVLVDSTGIKTVTLSQALSAGTYLAAMWCQASFTCTFWYVNGSPFSGKNAADGTSPNGITVSGATYGALPASATFSASAGAGQNFPAPLMVRMA